MQFDIILDRHYNNICVQKFGIDRADNKETTPKTL